jgi:hypothetical protein
VTPNRGHEPGVRSCNTANGSETVSLLQGVLSGTGREFFYNLNIQKTEYIITGKISRR